MGWIAALLMGVFALVALAVAAGYHRREGGRLRNDHDDALTTLKSKSQKRVDRLDRDFQRQLESAHHPLAIDLFPALDSLDSALDHLHEADHPAEGNELHQGLLMARSALDDALARHGIEAILPEPGQPFAPEVHEAIAVTEEESFAHNEITKVFRRGYRDAHRVLRPALVEVNAAPDAREGDAEVADDQIADQDEPDSADPPPSPPDPSASAPP